MITTPTPCRILVAALLFLQPVLHANPKGGTVTNGAISITQGPGGMTINQAGPRGIIQWQDFSIGAGEFTRFIHSNSGSATLNRVVGGIPSTIHGTLQANGQVYLINPNGILVGPNGRINTAGFVASTLDVPDAQFMAGGDMRFSGSSIAGVTNLGTITASDDDVTLMGRTVTNAGSINAPNGTATLAAGSDILLKAAGDERVVINSGIAGGGTGAENSGSIHAAQAKLMAAGGNAYALAVNNTGVVNATGITNKNGRIFLGSDGGVVRNSGQLIARNADGSGGSVKLKSGNGGKTVNSGSITASASDPKKNGGTVAITGDRVLVAGTSEINDGGLNAGTVAIGVSANVAAQTSASGGIATLALGADAQAALQATIEAGSRIIANSTGAGDGGRVVVWSERQSVVGGTIEAKGGDQGGNGGLVETSGHTGLTITPGTKVNTAAPKGEAGTWLLDPAGLSVIAAGVTTTTGPPNFTQVLPIPTSTVVASDIVTALGSGNVKVQTTGAGGNSLLSVDADILLSGAVPANTLKFISAGGITINNAIGGGASNVTLSFQAGGGNIAFVGSGKASASATTTVYLDTHLTNAGTIASASAAAVSAGSLGIWSGAQGVGTSVSPFLTAVDNLVVTVNNNSAAGGGVFISNSSGGTLHIGGVTPLPLSGWPASSGISVPSFTGYLGVEIKNTAGNIRIDSATGEGITAYGNIKLTATGASSDILILNTGVNSIRSYGNTVTLTAGRDVKIGDAGTNVWGLNVRGKTAVRVQAGGDVTVAGSLLKAGAFGLTVTAGGDINIVNSNGFAAIIGTSGDAAVTLTAGAGKTLNNNTLATGGIKTTLADDISNAVSTGADININADKVVINAPIVSGTTGDVFFEPATGTRSIDVGTKDPAKLGFNNTELGLITARDLDIGSFTGTGGILVSHFIIGPYGFKNLALTTGGGVLVNQLINLPTSIVTLQGDSLAGGVNIGDSITANNLNTFSSLGSIIATTAFSKITANHLLFTATGSAWFTNPQNAISEINISSADVSTGKTVLVFTSGQLTVNGQVGTGNPGTTSVGLQVGANGLPNGNLILASSSKILSNDISLDVSHGVLTNNAGAGALVANHRYIVWLADKNGSNAKDGLTGTDYTRANFPAATEVTPFGDPLGTGNVFYYAANVTPPAPPAPPVTVKLTQPIPQDFVLSLPRLYRDTLSAPDPVAALRKLSLKEIFVLKTLIDGNSDGTDTGALARAIIAFLGLGDLLDVVEQIAQEKAAAENDRLVQEAKERKVREGFDAVGSFVTGKVLDLWKLVPTTVSPEAERDLRAQELWDNAQEKSPQSWDDYLAIEQNPDVRGTKRVFDLVEAELAPCRQEQLNAFTTKLPGFPQSWYDVLAPNGVFDSSLPAFGLSADQIRLLSKDQMMAIMHASGIPGSTSSPVNLSYETMKAIFNAGPIGNNTMAAIVAAGGGNFTVAQIIAAGGGNIVSAGGGNIVSAGGGNIMQALAQIKAVGGGDLTFNSIIAAGGGNVLGNGSASVLGNGSASLLANIASLIGSDASGFAAKLAAGIVSHNGSAIVSHNGSALLSEGAGAIVSHNASALGPRLGDAAPAIQLKIDAGITSKEMKAPLLHQDGSGLLHQDGSGAPVSR